MGSCRSKAAQASTPRQLTRATLLQAPTEKIKDAKMAETVPDAQAPKAHATVPHQNEADAEQDRVECAVCLDTIKQDERTTLPCSCKVDYCFSCWDRSLATSFTSGQHARCPTCRMSVRVDFDSSSCSLKFSRLDEASSVDEDAYETVERIAHQAIPATTRILQRYRLVNGVAIDGFLRDPKRHLNELEIAVLKKELEQRSGSAQGCVAKWLRVPFQHEKPDIIQRLLEVAADDSDSIASFLISATLDAPACPCGSSLKRLHNKARTICDLCDNKIPSKGCAWRCTNADRTILHATAYDVCDTCFQRHACAHGPIFRCPALQLVP